MKPTPFCQEIFVRKTMKRIKEKISESDMWVDGQFLSEASMKQDGMSEPPSHC